MSDKPTIILVPGAWHLPDAYQPLTSSLEQQGYKVVPIKLPTVVSDSEPAAENFHVDTKVIQFAILKEVDAGDKVALVVHSYGGFPGGAACEGYEPHISRLVYLCAFVADVGVSMEKALGGWLPWFEECDQGTKLKANNSEEIFYNDATPEQVEEGQEGLLRQSVGAFRTENPYAAFKHVDCAYIVCEKDNAIPPPIQEQLASQEGKWVMPPIRLDAGHIPFLAKLEETTKAVVQALS